MNDMTHIDQPNQWIGGRDQKDEVTTLLLHHHHSIMIINFEEITLFIISFIRSRYPDQ